MMTATPGANALIWVARTWSLASIAFVLVFLFGEGLNSSGPGPTAEEWIALTLWPGGVCIGLIIAWFRPALGGAIAVFCLIAFYVWHLLYSGGLPGGPYFFLVAAPGVLFILATLVSRSSHEIRTA
jgi:hypothetical protein